MKKVKNLLFCFGIFVLTGTQAIASGWFSQSSSTSSDDYETRISDLEDAMITVSKNMSVLQSQMATLQKEPSTGNNAYGSAYNYNAKNNLSAASPKKILTTEEQIIALQEQNITLQNDTQQRQKQMAELNNSPNFNPTALTRKKSINQNAITRNNGQISANNNQLASLQASAANAPAQTRSTLLGRMSSSVTSQAKALKNKIWKK